MLQLRPNCELCDKDLPPDSTEAHICSYECTFCAHCVETVLHNVCPNCGGGFVKRPIRPATAYRPGVSLHDDPPATERRHSKYSRQDIDAFVSRMRTIPAEKR